MFPIAPEGHPFILVTAVAGVLAWVFGFAAVAVALWLVALGCIAFFRDPDRRSDASPDVVLAPADGKVIALTTAPAKLEAFGLATQVSIFMSPIDVHINRAPTAGTVREATWTPGRKFPAYRDKASELNEHSFVVLDGPLGTVAYKQIAGSLARRVVCDLAPGQRVQRGQRVGLIKFSSRVDLFLPPTAETLVSVGQRTRAGVTPVARQRGSKSP